MRIAVVGAGVAGLLGAWELRRRGHRVTLIAPEIGQDASRAAAGMLAPISEVQYGQDRLYPLMTASRELYPETVRNLARATETPHGYRENGTLLVGATPSDLQHIAERAQVQRSYGMAVEAVPGSRLRRQEPALNPSLAGAYAAVNDGQIDPRSFMAALWDALTGPLPRQDFPDAGPPAEHIALRADRVDREDEGYRVRFADGTARHVTKVLLAPGLGYADIGGIPEQMPLGLRPIHGDILRLAVRPDSLLPGEEHVIRTTIRATVYGRGVYLVPRADGGVVVGASVREDGRAGVNVGAVHELLQDAITVVPAVRDMDLVETMARARPGTPDDIPYLGPLTEDAGVVVSTGYSRHGILLAPLGARLAADLLDGVDPGGEDAEHLAAMSPTRLSVPKTTTAPPTRSPA